MIIVAQLTQQTKLIPSVLVIRQCVFGGFLSTGASRRRFRFLHHHAIAREQLNLIRTLAPKVERQHGNKHPDLFQISEALAAISTELSFHLFWEETVLFPYILQLDTVTLQEFVQHHLRRQKSS